jgi:hypothetical protein
MTSYHSVSKLEQEIRNSTIHELVFNKRQNRELIIGNGLDMGKHFVIGGGLIRDSSDK